MFPCFMFVVVIYLIFHCKRRVSCACMLICGLVYAICSDTSDAALQVFLSVMYLVEQSMFLQVVCFLLVVYFFVTLAC